MSSEEMEKPTRTRYWVVVFAVALAVIQYIDRVCISKAAPTMGKELGLTKEDMGTAFSAFTLAYALFEIPGGWLGDKFGPRKVLIRVVCWWSVFTAATGWVSWIATVLHIGNLTTLLGFSDPTNVLRISSFATLVAVRFLFGAGEAGCFPNITRAFVNWLAPSERQRAQSVLWLSARWGGALTPLLVVFVLEFVSWQNAFVVFGSLGVIWAVIFFVWFKDNPHEHPSVNAAERKLLAGNAEFAHGHGNVPWRVFGSSATAWYLWVQYFCLSYVWYFYVTWLPTFLEEKYKVSLDETFTPAWGKYALALLCGVPLFCGGFGSLCSGLLVNNIAKKTGNLRDARRILGAVGFVAMGIAMALSPSLSAPVAVIAAFGSASFFGDLTMPCSWGACMDVGGRYAGTFSGSMNMMGNLGGAVSPWVVGKIVGATDNWALTYYLSAGMCLVGAVCWALVDTETPLDRSEHPHPRATLVPTDIPAERIEEL